MNAIFQKWSALVNPNVQGILNDLALLVLRVSLGLIMAISHGKMKLDMLLAGEAENFADPIGVGKSLSLILAVGAEFFCALAIVIGLGTRLALTQLIATMAVAAFIIHGADPFANKEMALLYLFPFIALILTGPGRLSVDHLIVSKLVLPHKS